MQSVTFFGLKIRVLQGWICMISTPCSGSSKPVVIVGLHPLKYRSMFVFHSAGGLKYNSPDGEHICTNGKNVPRQVNTITCSELNLFSNQEGEKKLFLSTLLYILLLHVRIIRVPKYLGAL